MDEEDGKREAMGPLINLQPNKGVSCVALTHTALERNRVCTPVEGGTCLPLLAIHVPVAKLEGHAKLVLMVKIGGQVHITIPHLHQIAPACV